MSDPRDTTDLGERRTPPQRLRTPRPFLSVWYRCCNTYGRMYRNADETAYAGRCPRCGAAVHATIGPDGTSRRMFEAR